MIPVNLPEWDELTTYAQIGVHDQGVEPELCWVDFETTGLDTDPESIPLEIGVVITDKFCQPRASFRSLIMEEDWEYRLARFAEPFVKDMHDKNGLIAHLARTKVLLPRNGPAPWHKVLSAKCVNEELFDFLHEHGPGENKMPMAGSTINFDRHFMRGWLMHCNDYLHYRNVDVSTVKNLCRMHNPNMYKHVPQVPKEDKAHRVMQDLSASMKEYMFYVDNFLDVE